MDARATDPQPGRSQGGVRRVRPELLAPAGDPLALRAAIASGADAVYLGMARFNARGRAERFRGLTLEACIRAAHLRGVRVYVTLNTLLHDDELPAALELAAEAQAAGADAAIVQDLGLASLLGELLPALPLHGSTQMTVHGPEQAVQAVERLGLKRIILARECTLSEAAAIAGRLRPLGAEAEVFVHGALCFAYSGQCLMSNFAGRRSANRGICAQNCRFDFSAGPVSGSSFVPLPVFEPRTANQLLSMKDLAAFESVAELAEAGVGSFKIEGRLKGPDYVAEVVRLYRSALDAWEEGRPFQVEEAERAAGRVYSRGFTNGYLRGRVEPSMRGDKRRLEGEPDATVLSANRKTGLLVLEPRPGHEVLPGQGYRYTHHRYRGGFRVIGVEPGPAGATADPAPVQGSRGPGAVLARVRFGSEASGRRYRRGGTGRRRAPPPLPLGLGVYLNDDPRLEAEVARLLEGVEVRQEASRVGLRLELWGRAGCPLRLRARAEDGRKAEVESEGPLEPARERPLSSEVLEEHLGRLGGTPYRLLALDSSALEPGVFLSLPALHALRRELVRKLDLETRGSKGKPEARVAFLPPREEPRRRRTLLSVCVGSPEALLAALHSGADRVVVEDGRLLAGDPAREAIWRETLAEVPRPWFRLPPIAHRPEDDLLALRRVSSVSPGAGVVAGHLGQIALWARAGLPAAADLYLNACNHRTIAVLAESGARRVTLSLEVDAEEAARIAGRSGPGLEIEVVAGGAVFSMLTRQSYGLEEGERFVAVSEHGHAYRFESGPGGTTALYEARELVGADALPHLAGQVDSLRLDLAHQDPAAVEEITAAYRGALDPFLRSQDGVTDRQSAAAGLITAANEAHRRRAPHGSFQGHLFRGARALDREE